MRSPFPKWSCMGLAARFSDEKAARSFATMTGQPRAAKQSADHCGRLLQRYRLIVAPLRGRFAQ